MLEIAHHKMQNTRAKNQTCTINGLHGLLSLFSKLEVYECIILDLLHSLHTSISSEHFQDLSLRSREHQVSHIQNFHLRNNTIG